MWPFIQTRSCGIRSILPRQSIGTFALIENRHFGLVPYNPLILMPETPPAWDDNLLQSNPHAVADKRRRVQQMFASIAPKYDLNNRLHSFGRDQAWRRKAVKLAGVRNGDRIVDVACGTGDLTMMFFEA